MISNNSWAQYGASPYQIFHPTALSNPACYMVSAQELKYNLHYRSTALDRWITYLKPTQSIVGDLIKLKVLVFNLRKYTAMSQPQLSIKNGTIFFPKTRKRESGPENERTQFLKSTIELQASTKL